MKKLLTMAIAITAVFTLQAQEFEVPAYKFETAQDYSQYEPDIASCTDWLISSPVNTERTKRNSAVEFIIKWSIGAPDVNFGLDPRIMTFINEQIPDYLAVYFGGWAKYAFDNKERLDALSSEDASHDTDSILAGLDAVMAFYGNNRSILPKDKGIEKYIKMKNKGTLRAYIEKMYL